MCYGMRQPLIEEGVIWGTGVQCSHQKRPCERDHVRKRCDSRLEKPKGRPFWQRVCGVGRGLGWPSIPLCFGDSSLPCRLQALCQGKMISPIPSCFGVSVTAWEVPSSLWAPSVPPTAYLHFPAPCIGLQILPTSWEH